MIVVDAAPGRKLLPGAFSFSSAQSSWLALRLNTRRDRRAKFSFNLCTAG
jgi:hypothetical protein